MMRRKRMLEQLDEDIRKAAPHRRPTMARRHSRAGVCETLA